MKYILLLYIFFPISFSHLNNLKTRFENSFTKSCLKYDFVNRYWNNLENPPDNYVVFVMSEPGVNHGGFGDRLAGLITAFFVSLRLNRGLLIESSDNINTLFRPYRNPQNHAPDFYLDSNNIDNKFTYVNWTSWTSYNPAFANNDLTELDLWFCVNNPKKNAECGLEHGDVEEPIIKFRINRSFLCRWMLHEGIPKTQLKELGLVESDDFMEIAGCALRLALWPTEKLWREVEIIYYQEILQEKIENKLQESSQEILQESSQESSSLDNEKINNHNKHNKHDNHDNKHNLRKLKHSIDKGKKEEKEKEEKEEFIVSTHFRCGDKSFIRKNNNHPFSGCVFKSNSTMSNEESLLMALGTPIEMGECAFSIIKNYTNFENKDESENKNENKNAPLLFIASDNKESSFQVSNSAKILNSFISPPGCHVELDKSFDCLKMTISYWFIMSLSDFIVTQTDNFIPTSSFSRYASIYGLRGDSIRSAKHCNNSLTRKEMSKINMGTWVCD